ncbi:FG-GAP-like repeat-containing protein [Streptomyces sp. NRRL F-5135]|uniref:FG-GAP-like repeat-containing protein n=1 Tax=Streptomyces sp. NRRL F-5135 TaxID=1463858 RepID=UPI00068C3139|nr:FG-GAP-like repeat-containing protein [Streptomyces sp. NRRL F-5135]
MRRTFAVVAALGAVCAAPVPAAASPTPAAPPATASAPAVAAPPAMAAAPYRGANTPAVQDDFNGDGHRDLAIGAPDAANGKVEGAGAVVVLYGSASGVSAGRRVVLTQATAGIPGEPERNDRFGGSTATADLDRDGYADLLVGVRDETVGSLRGRGAVTVVWGGPKGLTGGAGISPPSGHGEGHAPGCRFGMSLAAGDMTGDGAPEVGIASNCGGADYTGPFTRAGRPAAVRRVPQLGTTRGVVMGDVNGDGRAERFWLPGPTSGDVRGPVRFDTGAQSLVPLDLADGYTGRIGDVDGDGYGDLVTGIPDDEYLSGEKGAAHRGGEIQVLYGSAQGIPATQRPKVFHQDSSGVPGGGENGDQFGFSLSVGDVNGDGYADVLTGAPAEAIGDRSAAGAATLLRGSAAGLTGAGSVAYNQDTVGVPGAAEALDSFGESVHLTDLNKDGKAETVVGVPGENTDGCVWIARGAAGGPVAEGSVNICGKSAGVSVSGIQARFGADVGGARTTF